MRANELIDRSYGLLARSSLAVRAAVRVRAVSSAVIAKRVGPTTIAEENGECHLLQLLGPDVTSAVDVGANVGDWSAAALRLCPQLERIVCFDPGESAAAELARRFAGEPRVTVVPRALSDHSGTLTFWEEPGAGQMSSGVAGASNEAAVERRVSVGTLDDELDALGIGRVDLLKIDAEGLDLHVLRGAARTLRERSVGAVQFEYNLSWQDAGSTLRQAYALLEEAGYRTLLLAPDGVRDFPLHSLTELFAYANFVALCPEYLARFEPVRPGW